MTTIQGVNLLPSTGEFTYDTVAHLGQRTSDSAGVTINCLFAPGGGVTDYTNSMLQLAAAHPECTTVSLVVAWFGNNVSVQFCQIYPSTTYINGAFQSWNGSAYVADNWQCSSLTQASAGLIPLSQTGGSFNYGGTPSDQAIYRCIKDLKARGYRVVFYPFILMDTTGFPWRGTVGWFSADVSAAATSAINGFLGSAAASQFTRDNINFTVSYSGSPTDFTYRRMILHYANLCVVAGGVDLFLIGSELRGLEAVRGPAWTVSGAGPPAAWDYPFVAGLITLAADVRGVFDGAGLTKDLTGLHNLISYAPDWSVWTGVKHDSANPPTGVLNGAQWPNLDALYASANIDIVCFDNYLPLSDWTTGAGGLDVIHWADPKPVTWPPSGPAFNGLGLSGVPALQNVNYLKANIEGGEDFNWFYFNSTNLGPGDDPNGSGIQVSLPQGDRLTQTRNQFFPGQELLARKKLAWWWNNTHFLLYDDGLGGGLIPHGNATSWAVQSKSIAFTEYGFASTDRATNQPNVFFSFSAAASQTPFWSKWVPTGGADQAPIQNDVIQQLGLQAIYDYWFTDGNNQTSSGGVVMLQKAFFSVWNWDARPFPAFPGVYTAFGDSVNWRVGFWINGKDVFSSSGGPAMTLAYPLSWPQQLKPVRLDLSVVAMSRSGGQGIAGGEQIIASPAARWEGSLTFPAMDSATLVTWRGFIGALQGRLGTFNMPIFDCGHKPFPSGGAITVTAAAAALNATVLTLTVAAGGALLSGHRFSIAGRLYEIIQSVPAGGGVYAATIHPWLRSAIGAATICEFSNPTSLMRLASDAEGRLDLESLIIAHPRIQIVEAF